MALKSSARRRGLLLGVYALAALLGYVLGGRGLFPLHLIDASTPLTPLARLGFALQQEELPNDASAWEISSRDVAAVRETWQQEEQRSVFDLVVAVRGLESRGEPSWDHAARACTALGWARCDREALEALRERSRP